MYPILRTKPGRDVTVVGGHPWLFSGALAAVPDDLPNGSPVSIANPAGEIFATGLYSCKSMIAVRVCEFREAVLDASWLRDKIQAADNRRRLFGLGTDTDNGYRVVFGESDGLPGLVVDRYNDVFVIQLAMVGMDLMRDTVVACLVELFKPTAIFERSDLPSRKDEGLQPEVGLRHGTLPEQVIFNRQDRKYIAPVDTGQKTGFFLDQEDLRNEVAKVSNGRKCADLFSYTGAAGLAALQGGATSVQFVDSSQPALDVCRPSLT